MSRPAAQRAIAVVCAAATILACGRGSTPTDVSVNGAAKVVRSTPFQAAAEQLSSGRDCHGGTLAKTVPFYKKRTGQWCWAASGEMVTAFFDKPSTVKQCTQAQDLCAAKCAQVDCCATPTPKQCVIPGSPTIDRHGFSVTEHPHPLEPSEIVKELGCDRRPFIYTWSANGGGGHQMVAIDFVTKNGTDYVLTHDPDGYRSFPTSYTAYRDGYGKNGIDLVKIRKGS